MPEQTSDEWDLQGRAVALDAAGSHVGGPPRHFARDGRLQLIALLRRGLHPHAHVVDVGCGSLRAGYWLIHFLEPGHYHGIDPMQANVDAARQALLEPGLEAAKRPGFHTSSDFDIGVVGVAPTFVLARSIWSHASKSQIQALLDSFAAVAAQDALLLASYIPASDPADGASRLDRVLSHVPVRRRSAPPRRPDYQGDGWAGWGPESDVRVVVIAHSFAWIAAECEKRGLVARASPDDGFGGQVWLEITRRSRDATPAA